MVGMVIYKKIVVMTEFDLSSVIMGKLLKVSGTAVVEKEFDATKEGINKYINNIKDLETSVYIGDVDKNSEVYEKIVKIINSELSSIIENSINEDRTTLRSSDFKELVSDKCWLDIKKIL